MDYNRMNKINQLTPEQEALIPVWIERWKAIPSKPSSDADIRAAMLAMYESMGEEPPMVLIFDSPMQCEIVANILPSILESDAQLFNQLDSRLNNQLYNQLDTQLDTQLSAQLYNQLRGQLRDQLVSRLNNQLSGQLRDQIYDQIRDQINYKLSNRLYNQLRNQLDAQFYDQLNNQLDAQLSAQLRDQLSDQLDSQLEGQLSDKLDKQLGNDVSGQLYSQLRCYLYNHLFNQLDDQFGNQINDQLREQLREQLRDQLDDQLRDQFNDRLFSRIYDQLRDPLSRQFWDQLDDRLFSQINKTINFERLGYCNIWWLAWQGFYAFSKHIGVQFDDEKYNLFEQFNHHVTYTVPFKGLAITSRKATAIHWQESKLHAEAQKAVEFADGWGWYAYDGQALPEKYGALPVSQWQPQWVDEEKNADVRTALLKGIGYDRWIAETGGETIHEQVINGLPYALITRDDPTIGIMKFLKMKNPSVPGVFHIEPVAPFDWIQTCEKALLWRMEHVLKAVGKDPETATLKDIEFMFIK